MNGEKGSYKGFSFSIVIQLITNYKLIIMTRKEIILATSISALSVMAGFCMGSMYTETKPIPFEEAKIGGNIDIEYYLEVSEDSIWVEGVQSKKVYSGKYSDLDSLIIQDNL